MTATTTVETTGHNRRVIVTVAVVLAAHAAVLALLANMKTYDLKRVEPPKPIEVKFVQLAPPPPPPPPKPKPKPEPKPKEVKVVKPQPKPLPKPKPILATPTPSAQPQVVVPIQPDPPPKPEPQPQPQPDPLPVKKVDQPPAAPAQPVAVDSIAYDRMPKIEQPSNSELKGEARKVVVRIVVNAAGKVDEVTIVQSSGITSIDNSVKRAVKRATFHPYRNNGVASPASTLIPVEFKPS